MRLPRGIRNNNPGNLRRSKDRWRGLCLSQTDPDFFQFKTPEDGLRALMIVLKNYQKRHGLKTVRGIVARWAPPLENDTNGYVAAVCDSICVRPDSAIDLEKPGVLVALSRAIVRHENGRPVDPFDPDWWYVPQQYVEACARTKI